MKKTKVNTFWRIVSDKTTYSQANYDEDVESLKALYQSRGYKDVVVKDPKLEIFVKNPNAKPKKIKRRVRITIPLVEGDQFFTGDIRVVRVNQGGQPADPPTTDGDSGGRHPQGVLRAASGLGPEPGPDHRGAPADRDEVQVARLHLLVRGPGVPRGRRPQGRHRR